jgi:3-dehydroquinate dehydratase/shikimate dehydrogenase
VAQPLLCVTVAAATTADLIRQRDCVDQADLIELRLDTLADVDVAAALSGRRRPVIVTCRPTWEGGHFTGSEEERQRLLRMAVELRADYIDVEWQAAFAKELLALTGGRRFVVSSHDFTGVPADLDDRVRAMRATGAEVVKLAVKASRLSDCLPLMDVGATMGQDGNLVVIAMGERGLASRVLPSRFQSAWTYAGPIEGVGQIGAGTLIDDYHFRRLGESTEVYGLVGSPIAYSVSPAMHNAAFGAATLDAVYLPLPAADADDFVTFARAVGLKGASVTIPFKVPLFDRVDEVYPVARRVGAINTIREVDGRWLGGNTDVEGFLVPLRERGISTPGMRATILGAGGSARAVAVGLSPICSEVTVCARDESRARDVASIVPARAARWPPEPGSWDLLVNCTPIGMHPHVDETPVPAERLTGRLVYDLVYNPTTTRLLREAASVGCDTIGGLEMLVAQAHEQFRWWTGARPLPGVMRAAALRRLSEMSGHEDHVV